MNVLDPNAEIFTKTGDSGGIIGDGTVILLALDKAGRTPYWLQAADS